MVVLFSSKERKNKKRTTIPRRDWFFFRVFFIILITLGAGFLFYCKLWDIWDYMYYRLGEEEIDFYKLTEDYEESLWSVPERSIADDLVATLEYSHDGYYFNNITYDDESRSYWTPRTHNQQLRTIVNNFGKDLINSDEEVREYVIGTLDYWLKNDFQSLNWWHNEISTPQEIADIGIMLKNHLSEEQISKIEKIVERGILARCSKAEDLTGANILETVDTTIQYSFFADKGYYLKKAVDYAEKEILKTVGDTEGIKKDYTFYQHGAQQAIASYGLEYVSILSNLSQFLDGTLFQLSSEKMGILVDFILYGQRYAIRGNNSNYLTNGRSFSRKNGNSANVMKNSIGILMSVKHCPKKDELQEFYNSFDDLSYSINDTKYFTFSHTLFDISPDYYMAVKGAHFGFINSELVNSENLLSRNLGYGGTTTYQYRGDEYNEISALWDFSKLPGTTAYNETEQELLNYHGNSEGYYYRSSTFHSGGSSNGKKGAVYVDIENEEGIYARQAYISYNGLMVCLGNSLRNTNDLNTKEVFTTINQVYAQNATYKGLDIEGTTEINDSSAIYNGKFAYYNLEGDQLIVEVSNVTGNLNRNNPSQNQEYTKEIFKLYYNYGINPEDQSFAYVVLANPQNNAPLNSSGLPIARITNTNAIQAVEFTDGTTIIIFHRIGTFTTISAEDITGFSDTIRLI